MNDTSAALAVLSGLAIRLMIPLLVTGLIVFALSRLDQRWQNEGTIAPLKVEKPECWKSRHCTAAQRDACAGYKSSLPCWQVFRLNDGYLASKCLTCPVLAAAPVPGHA